MSHVKTMPTLLADFRQGVSVRFVLTSPAQQVQYRQFVDQLRQHELSYEVMYDIPEGVVLIHAPKEQSHE